jgi:hypothetical protein
MAFEAKFEVTHHDQPLVTVSETAQANSKLRQDLEVEMYWIRNHMTVILLHHHSKMLERWAEIVLVPAWP